MLNDQIVVYNMDTTWFIYVYMFVLVLLMPNDLVYIKHFGIIVGAIFVYPIFPKHKTGTVSIGGANPPSLQWSS